LVVEMVAMEWVQLAVLATPATRQQGAPTERVALEASVGGAGGGGNALQGAVGAGSVRDERY
jgi:hypothetical protein